MNDSTSSSYYLSVIVVGVNETSYSILMELCVLLNVAEIQNADTTLKKQLLFVPSKTDKKPTSERCMSVLLLRVNICSIVDFPYLKLTDKLLSIRRR